MNPPDFEYLLFLKYRKGLMIVLNFGKACFSKYYPGYYRNSQI